MWRSWRGWSSLPVMLLQLACDRSPEPAMCDPLGAVASPIELGEIVGIGRDVDGTIYVADEDDGEARVFVSEDDVLVRQRVAGSGGGGGGGVELASYTVDDHQPPFVLQIETTQAGTRMGVLFDPGEAETFVIGEDGVELEVLGVDDVAGMPIANLPGDIVIEYAAELDDGQVLVVIRPRDDWDYEDLRAFFGPVDDLVERSISDTTRLTDGGSTTIALEIDGSVATASFPVLTQGDMFVPGPATLELGGQALALTLLPNVPPDGATYRCL